jgi:hypothetical protein
VAGAERRRRAPRRGRRGARPPQPPAAPAQRFRGIPVTRLGLLVLLLLGFWLGRAASLFPGDVLDVAVAVVSAVALALWYRRRAREYMRQRAAARERASKPRAN